MIGPTARRCRDRSLVPGPARQAWTSATVESNVVVGIDEPALSTLATGEEWRTTGTHALLSLPVDWGDTRGVDHRRRVTYPGLGRIKFWVARRFRAPRLPHLSE